MPTRSSRSKKNGGSTKKSKNTIAPMPSLIFQEGTLSAATHDERQETVQPISELPPAPEKPARIVPLVPRSSPHDVTARRLLWAGVAIFSIMICGVWSWSLYSQLSHIKLSAGSEATLIDKAKKEWQDAALKQPAGSAEYQYTKAKLQTVLAQLAHAAILSSSTTVSSTNAAITSTSSILLNQ